jgi:hypothetical protein
MYSVIFMKDTGPRRGDGAVRTYPLPGGGVLDLLKLLLLTAWSSLVPSKAANTQLVNAVIAGGWKDEAVRQPVVMKI